MRERGTPGRVLRIGVLLLMCVPLAAVGEPAGIVIRQDSAALALLEAVRQALATHPGMGVAEAELRGSDAQLAQVRSSLLPRLTFEAGGTRFEEPMIVAPLHGFDPMRPPGFDRTLLQGRLLMGYTLFDGGARGARIEQARAGVGAAEANEAVARGVLIERVVRSYLRVHGGREIVAAHRAQALSLEAEHDRAERMLSAGSVARVALLRADAALSRARAAEAVAAASLREAEAELARLMGTDAAELTEFALEGAAPSAQAGAPDRGTSIDRARVSSPTVERARRRVQAAEAARKEAGAAYWPTLSLAGGYNAFASASDAAIMEWQAALQLSWPVFTGGGRPAAIGMAAAQVAGTREALRLAEQDVAAEVDRALTALEEAEAQSVSLEAAVAQFEEVVQIESLALQTGAGVQSDYLGAVSDLLETRAALTGARAGAVGARVTVARLTGELTVEWLERMVEVRR